MLLSLPTELWLHIPLDRQDLGALALTCRQLRDAVAGVLCAKGVSVGQSSASVLSERRRWEKILSLRVHGMPRRYGIPESKLPVLEPLRLGWLTSLTLHHCHLPRGGSPFWPAVFEYCPRLTSVSVTGDFFMGNYADDLNHTADLVVHGAPRLHRLDVQGNWLVIHPLGWTAELDDILKATARVYGMKPVESTTLRYYRAACKQAPLGVDAPLDTLEIEEPSEPPYVVARMGPLVKQHVQKMTWKHSYPSFDAGLLAPYQALRALDLQIDGSTTPARLNHCLKTLAGLPRGLRNLTMKLELWAMRTLETDIVWGRPLQHLDALETLDIRMLFPPSSVAGLLGEWLGAGGPSLRRVEVTFEEPVSRGYEYAIQHLIQEEEADPEDEIVTELREAWARAEQPVAGGHLSAWLLRHPGATAVVRGMRQRFTCDHPRAEVV